MSNYNGKCPLCSGQLILDNDELICSIFPEHFKIKQALFESAWNKYNGKKIDTLGLLNILISDSTAKNTPKYLDFVTSLENYING